ncbi:MAG: DnaJ domain-containing protein [Chloroflexaceae bacterium]|nr:DnaJ domain-containing protein [Chloroflexaceae bacterium]
MHDFEQFDHYQILGVERNATADEIKRAYRRQMAQHHPDRYANASSDEQEYARERSLRINEAYRVLSDFHARAKYNHENPLNATAQRAKPKASSSTNRAASRKNTPPRDHQAELYQQARSHLDAGRPVEAAAALRELQQMNPFYRDSAALLAQAERASMPVPQRGHHRRRPRQARSADRPGCSGQLAVAASSLSWACCLHSRGYQGTVVVPMW